MSVAPAPASASDESAAPPSPTALAAASSSQQAQQLRRVGTFSLNRRGFETVVSSAREAEPETLNTHVKGSNLNFVLNKYRIAALIAPIALASCVLRYILETQVPGFMTGKAGVLNVGLFDIGGLSTVLSSGIFLLVFIATGIMNDYKEVRRHLCCAAASAVLRFCARNAVRHERAGLLLLVPDVAPR